MNADVSKLIDALGNELAQFQPSSFSAAGLAAAPGPSATDGAPAAEQEEDEVSHMMRRLEVVCRDESAKHTELMSARASLQGAWDQLQLLRDRAAVLLCALDAATAEDEMEREGGDKGAADDVDSTQILGTSISHGEASMRRGLPDMDAGSADLAAFRDKLDVRALLWREYRDAEAHLEDARKSVNRLSGSILALHGETDEDGGDSQSSEMAAALRTRLDEARALMEASELDFNRSQVLCKEFDAEVQLAAIHIAAKARVGGFSVPTCVTPFLDGTDAENDSATEATAADKQKIGDILFPEGSKISDESEGHYFSVQDVIDGRADVPRMRGEKAAHYRERLERRLRVVEPMVLQLKRSVDQHVETVRDLRLQFKDLEVERLRLELALVTSKDSVETADAPASPGKKSVTFDGNDDADPESNVKDSARNLRITYAESDEIPRAAMLNAALEVSKGADGVVNHDVANARSRSTNPRRTRISETEEVIPDFARGGDWDTPQRSHSAPSAGLSARRARLTASAMKRRDLADASFAHIKEMIDTSMQSIESLDSAQAFLKYVAAPSPGGLKLQKIREMFSMPAPHPSTAIAFDSPLSPVRAPGAAKKSYVLGDNLESPLDNVEDSKPDAVECEAPTGASNESHEGVSVGAGDDGTVSVVSPVAPTWPGSPTSGDVVVSPVRSPSPRPVRMSKNELNEQVRRVTKEMASSPFVMRTKDIDRRSPSPLRSLRAGSADELESRMNALVTPSADRSPSPAHIRAVSRSSPDRTRAVFQQQSSTRRNSFVASMSSDSIFSHKTISQIRDHIRNEQRKIEECYIKLDALLINREKLKKQLREIKAKKTGDKGNLAQKSDEARSKVQLKLMIVMARNLAEPNRSQRPLDPFVEIWAEAVTSAGSQQPQSQRAPPRVFVEGDDSGGPMEMLRYVTNVKRSQLAPRWDETFDITLPCTNKAGDMVDSEGKNESSTTMVILDRSLRIFVRDSIRNSNEMVEGFQNIIGECFLDLTALLDQKSHTLWLPISDVGIPKRQNIRPRKLPNDCALKVQARLLYSKELFVRKKLADITSEMEELMGFVEVCSNGLIDLVHTWDQMQEKRARLEELRNRDVVNVSKVSNVSLPRSISRDRRGASDRSAIAKRGGSSSVSSRAKSNKRADAPTPIVEAEAACVVKTYTIPPTPTVHVKAVAEADAVDASGGPAASLQARRAAMIAKIKAGEDLLPPDEYSAMSESTHPSIAAPSLPVPPLAPQSARSRSAPRAGESSRNKLGSHPSYAAAGNKSQPVNMSIFKAAGKGRYLPPPPQSPFPMERGRRGSSSSNSNININNNSGAPYAHDDARRARSRSVGRRPSQTLWR